MRFLPNGPVIPDALVKQQERGGAVFMCGAGVSMMAGLPSFSKLVEGVYERLGEDWMPHHAEREAMTPGGRMGGQYDRALRCLERRLAAHDVRQASGLRHRIRDAVDAQLRAPESADLANHLALLELSRGSDNASRLLTTNFDCLFERAWTSAGHPDLPSHAGPAMPRQGTAAFEGVLHLHGRIADAGQTETELVLTSAAFGEAYLRSGWAARYVYDLARAGTLVLVGYQVDDPPMRYLLEVLEDDRARYPDLQQVYAFAPASAESEDLERAMWAAKGIEPIIYPSAGPADHGSLYSSLRAWRDYAVSPGRWREARLRELLAEPPSEEPATEEIVAALSHEDAPVLLNAIAPEPAWWPVLSTRPMLRDCPAALRAWITARADDPAMLKACVADRPVGAGIYDGALWRADQGNPPMLPDVARGWRLLARAVSDQGSGDHGSSWFRALTRIQNGDIDHAVRKAAVDAVRPRLSVTPRIEWPGATHPSGVEAYCRLSFDPDQDATTDGVLEHWPRETAQEAALLRLADRSLADALDEAADAGYQRSFDRADADVRSFSAPAGVVESGFGPLARLVAGLWNRIAAADPRLARSLASAWRDDVHPLRRRLRLHALALPGVLDGAEVAEALSQMDDLQFWTVGGREVATILAARWSELPAGAQEAFQSRVMRGPPRDTYPPSTEDGWWEIVRDNLMFRRLEPIRRAGGMLSKQAERALADLFSRYPEGSLTLPEDDEDNLRCGFVDLREQAAQLASVADDVLVAETLRATRHDRFQGGEAWRLLCQSEPLRALRGILVAPVDDRARPEVLAPLLSAAGNSDASGFQEGLAGLLLGLPSGVLSGHVAAAAARWMEQKGTAASKGQGEIPDAMPEVWDKIADGVLVPSASTEEEKSVVTLEEAMTVAGGIIARALIAMLAGQRLAPGQSFPTTWQARLDRLAQAVGRSGTCSRVLLVHDLAFLHCIDPAWAERTLVPRLSWTDAEAPALWPARANGRIGSAALFNALKPAFLEAVRRADGTGDRARDLAMRLVEVARWKLDPAAQAYQLLPTEVRATLACASADARRSAAWALWRWAAEIDDAVTPADRWRFQVGQLFNDIWPLDAASRDGGSSRYLAWMALEAGDAFPEAEISVQDFIVPFDLIVIDGALMPDDRRRKTAAMHPSAFLRLIDRIIAPHPERIPTDLRSVLDACRAADTGVALEPAYRRLDGLARRAAS